jgi:hypothetical protein
VKFSVVSSQYSVKKLRGVSPPSLQCKFSLLFLDLPSWGCGSGIAFLSIRKGVKNMNWSETRKVLTTAWRVVQAPIAAKHRRQIFFSMLVLLFLGSNTHAKTKNGDWRAVENLEPGTHVIVKAQHKCACTLEGANEEQLVCWVHVPRSFRTVSLAIPRAEIREVRKLPEPHPGRDALIGAAIGAGAGAIAGASDGPNLRGTHAFLGSVGGAGFGAFGGMLVGATNGIFQILVRHGKLVYRQ